LPRARFYLYFPGKKEIFLDLVDALGERLRAVTLDASAKAATYAEAQRLGFSAFFDFARTHRHIYRIIQECDRVDPITYRRFYSLLAGVVSARPGRRDSPRRSRR